ncbi:killer cell lectin-like receptor subfamily B member 1B allele A isoform X1 [Bufo gargarizans]|uniref:killer cell lectin-like receptor subfamily B member 1B allele A isoform X1 n=1 Tax=Bufo gargarizans TaxID=30331 RepID=UPI001CF22E5B|nr:killer cell lectin-like receptor subfamily B member 1B allele A isoform X1 [Bufo gargarizans]
MRRIKKSKASTKYLHMVLVIVAIVLKVMEVSAILIIVQKLPCNTTTEDYVQNFQEETNDFDLNIPQKYIDAYYAIIDLCAATGNVCELCPLDWDAFNGKCYLFSEDRNNWPTGSKNCQLRKAELISIEDSNERDFILRHVSSKNGHFWIGLTRNGSDWYWKKGGKFQGNISGSSEEHQCASYGKDLSAENCFNPNKWICKKNMSRY